MRSLFLCVISLFCLLSCGLEDFYFIDYIGIVDYTTRYSTTIRLSSNSDEGYNTFFSNFIIFYRIYISDVPTSSTLASNPNEYLGINTSLNSDYNSLYSLTDTTSTTVSTTNLETRFSNQRYFQLAIEEANIENILGTGSLGRTLLIEFPLVPGERPTLTLDGGTTRYTLKRAESSPGLNFRPVPLDDLYFLNYTDLSNTENATSEINADVATKSNMTPDSFRYTYVSLYIAAKGKSFEMPPQPVYSQPAFVGIFMLASDS